MAWWVDALFQNMLPGDIVSSDLLNAIQQGVVDIGGGGRSLKKLTVDGVGKVSTTVASGFASILKGIVIPGGADADTAFDVTGTPTTRRRVLSVATGGPRLRLFITATQAELTFNADYDGTAMLPWKRDSADLAGRLVLSTAGALAGAQVAVEWFDASATSTWATASWIAGLSSRKGRLLSGGTSIVSNDVSPGVGFGVGATCTAASGNDTAGTFSITTGGAPAIVASATVALKDGSFPGSSIVLVSYAAHQALVLYPPLAGEISGGTLQLAVAGTLSANQSYTFNYLRIGI